MTLAILIILEMLVTAVQPHVVVYPFNQAPLDPAIISVLKDLSSLGVLLHQVPIFLVVVIMIVVVLGFHPFQDLVELLLHPEIIRAGHLITRHRRLMPSHYLTFLAIKKDLISHILIMNSTH